MTRRLEHCSKWDQIPRVVDSPLFPPLVQGGLRVSAVGWSASTGPLHASLGCPTEEFPSGLTQSQPADWLYDVAFVPGMSVPQMGVLCVGTNPLFSARSVQMQIGRSCPKTVEKLIVFGRSPLPL